jgi:hypothetical protein
MESGARREKKKKKKKKQTKTEKNRKTLKSVKTGRKKYTEELQRAANNCTNASGWSVEENLLPCTMTTGAPYPVIPRGTLLNSNIPWA